MKMKIIVLTGWAGAGKDTVADILQEHYGYKRCAFATSLKDTAAALFRFPREWADTQEGKLQRWRVGYQEKTIRDILLDIARLDRERFGEDVYASEVVKFLETQYNIPDSAVVITDLRFPNELNCIRQFQANRECELEIWKVLREGQTESPVNDPTEHYLDNLLPDVYIHNNGKSKEDLQKNIFNSLHRQE